MGTVDDSHFSLKISGVPSGKVDCANEEYLVSGTDLTMPNMEVEGDCVHDQFKAASLKLISATYDEGADVITMKAKWKLINVTIKAKKVAEFTEEEESDGPLKRILA